MAPKSEKKVKKGPSLPVKVYLFAYNFIQTLGWSYLFYLLVTHHLFNTEGISFYERIKWTVIIFQNAALLEVVHAVLGLVAASPMMVAPQVASRVFVVCGVLIPTAAAKVSIGLPIAITAWSITEIVRYGYYALNLMNAVPYFLTWLRYSTFLILYPIGITGELLCIYAAQGEVKNTGLWTVELPNTWNFSYYYYQNLYLVMFMYIPFFPQLYTHMLNQRRKMLGGVVQKCK